MGIRDAATATATTVHQTYRDFNYHQSEWTEKRLKISTCYIYRACERDKVSKLICEPTCCRHGVKISQINAVLGPWVLRR